MVASFGFRGIAALCVCTSLAACWAADAHTTKKSTPVDPGADFYGDDITGSDPIEPAGVDDDSGAFTAPTHPRPEAGTTPPRDDGGSANAGLCPGPLVAGDLAIVELMISARSGSNDDGEWVEIQNMRECTLSLGGITVESPRGAVAPDVAAVGPLQLAPGRSFIVADSVEPALNHALPGPVFAWGSTDVLKNSGDTVLVKSGNLVVDTVTYPSFSNLTPGRALSFPSDCGKGADRTDWANWSLTFDSWTAGFEGTPNAPNDDVTCD